MAVAAVVLDHAWHWPARGYLGVDVFFVIFGFVITSSLLRQHSETGAIDVADFMRRRLFRLLPSAVVVITATLALVWSAFPTGRARSDLIDGLAGLTGWVNWRFAAAGTDYFDVGAPPSVFQHFWSVSVEEQFYLLWSVLLLVLVRAGTRRTAILVSVRIAAASLAAAALGASATGLAPGAYFVTPYRVWELLAGALLAFVPAAPARALPVLVRQVAGTIGGVLLVGALSLDGSRLRQPSRQPYRPSALPCSSSSRACTVARWPRRSSPLGRCGVSAR